jgi:hypothetical protein
MKDQLKALWAKVIENKHIVIPVCTAVVGGLIGGKITSVIINRQEPQVIWEDVVDQNDTIHPA